MAKKKDFTNVGGNAFQAGYESEPVISAAQDNTHKRNTQDEYTMPQEELRTKRVQIVLQPSLNAKLDRLVKEKKIKSKNDLIHFLLEKYVEKNQ